jgi:uncharacterized OsmC-like protein
VGEEPTYFGVHSEIAAHYGVDTEVVEPHNATLDYVVAAAAGWLTGTFGGALEARQIPASGGRLISQATGEIELEGKVLVIRRIHVRYHLQIDPAEREVAERVHGFHADFCPVARTIRGCVEVTTSLEMEDIEG